MKVTVVSPEKTLFTGEAEGVKLPGELGRFEVLENHAPLISTLSPGRVQCCGGEGESFSVDVKGGFVEVARNEVSVCVEL